MHRMTNFAIGLACGGAAAVALVLACGDDGAAVDAGRAADARAADATAAVDAPAADAAACDCPAAEPPLAGRIQRITEENQLEASEVSETVVISCPSGGVMLGGGCNFKDDNAGPIMLRRSGPGTLSPQVWQCTYEGDTVVGTEATIVGTAYCLMPPE